MVDRPPDRRRAADRRVRRRDRDGDQRRDAPALAIVYKLVAVDGAGRIKLSPGKKSYPWAKQVYRWRDPQGRFVSDRITRADEPNEGEPLLVPLIRAGKLVAALPRLDVIRRHCLDQLAALLSAAGAPTCCHPTRPKAPPS